MLRSHHSPATRKAEPSPRRRSERFRVLCVLLLHGLQVLPLGGRSGTPPGTSQVSTHGRRFSSHLERQKGSPRPPDSYTVDTGKNYGTHHNLSTNLFVHPNFWVSRVFVLGWLLCVSIKSVTAGEYIEPWHGRKYSRNRYDQGQPTTMVISPCLHLKGHRFDRGDSFSTEWTPPK